MSKNQKNVLNFFFSSIVMTILIVPFLASATLIPTPSPTIPTQPTPTIPTQPPTQAKPLNIEIKNPFNCGGQDPCTIPKLIEVIVNKILMPIGGVVAVVMIMYAGFMYVTAAGNESQVKKAHDALLWGVIGAAILLGAWVISEAIGGTIADLKKP